MNINKFIIKLTGLEAKNEGDEKIFRITKTEINSIIEWIFLNPLKQILFYEDIFSFK